MEVNVGSLAPDFRLESNGGAFVRLSDPQASVEKDELMREVEQLEKKEIQR